MSRYQKIAILLTFIAWNGTTLAQVTPEQALKFSPVQPGIEYDRPDKNEIGQCTVALETSVGVKGYVVRNPGGQVIRRFLDLNGDQKVDQWCYFKDGVEVYRDIDSDFNKKADQYRWLGIAGAKWGIDKDEDGKIDEWKMISPEEVTEEIVAAVREGDKERFRRLLLTKADAEVLELSEEKTEELVNKSSKAVADFDSIVRNQKLIQRDTTWVSFGGNRPGVLLATPGFSKQDLVVYENVAAFVEKKGKSSQLAIGSLIKVGDSWKALDLPSNLENDEENAAIPGFFFQVSATQGGGTAPAEQESEINSLMDRISRFEKIAENETGAKREQAISDLTRTFESIVEKASATERDDWITQYCEFLYAHSHDGTVRDAIPRLEKLAKWADENGSSSLATVRYRMIDAQYHVDLKNAKKDVENAKIQEGWLKSLEEFASQHAKSQEAAEALRQIALNKELSQDEDGAVAIYTRIAKDFPDSEHATRASGAKRRLELRGKPLELKGRTADGKPFDIASLKGKAVLVHYWTTDCEVCLQEVEKLKAVQSKFGKQLAIVGVSLDSDAQKVAATANREGMKWPHVVDSAGRRGALSTNYGIETLPVMFLVDASGKVVDRDLQPGSLEAAIKKLLK